MRDYTPRKVQTRKSSATGPAFQGSLPSQRTRETPPPFELMTKDGAWWVGLSREQLAERTAQLHQAKAWGAASRLSSLSFATWD